MKTGKKKREEIDTIIGPHTYFEGTLSCRKGFRIDGRLKGKIECDGSLVIGSEGKVEGEIVADSVFIAGELTGNVTAKNHLELTENGKVYGDITTAKLVIDQGVIFEGRCRMFPQQDILGSSDSLALPAPAASARSHVISLLKDSSFFHHLLVPINKIRRYYSV